MKLTTTLALAGIVLLCGMPFALRADEYDQKTTLTFSEPVELPGQVLPAGTYMFILLDSQSDRDMVEVFNENKNHLYGLFMAVPDYRMKPTDKTVIRFEERAANSPEAIKAWFYPGDNYGHEFVYPKKRAKELAKANKQPVPAMPDELSAATKDAKPANVSALKTAKLTAAQPNGDEVATSQAFQAPPTHQHAKSK
jgi:hypothetical protein